MGKRDGLWYMKDGTKTPQPNPLVGEIFFGDVISSCALSSHAHLFYGLAAQAPSVLKPSSCPVALWGREMVLLQESLRNSTNLRIRFKIKSLGVYAINKLSSCG